jgi:hypothetical protein
MLGVKLDTGHKQGVWPQERAEVKKRFAEGPLTFVGTPRV